MYVDRLFQQGKGSGIVSQEQESISCETHGMRNDEFAL